MSLDIDVNFLALKGYICSFEVYKNIEVILKVFKDMSEILPWNNGAIYGQLSWHIN